MFASSSWWNLGGSDPTTNNNAGTQEETATVSGSANASGGPGSNPTDSREWDQTNSTPMISDESEETGSEEVSNEESDESELDDMAWKDWFLSLPGNDFLISVDDDYIEDQFNLTGLSSLVPYYSDAIDVILDNSIDDDADVSALESSAQLLYTLIHARFVITKPGLQEMVSMVEKRRFGSCPRTYCYGYPLLPIGEQDSIGVASVKLYCNNCHDIYHPTSRYSRLDGAAFGSSFPHMVFQNYPDLHDKLLKQRNNHPNPESFPLLYVPKVFGFRLAKTSILGGSHASWLRWQPNCNLKTGFSNSVIPTYEATLSDTDTQVITPNNGRTKESETMELDSTATKN